MKKLRTAALLAILAAANTALADNLMTFGTGSQTGVYYVVGNTACKLLSSSGSGYKCNASTSAGSVANIRSITAGDSQFGMAESGWQYNAYNGGSIFEGKADKKLRAVFSVHPEYFSIITRPDTGIHNLNDLQGKRVNIAEPGSGTRATLDLLLKEKGWTHDKFALASELKTPEAADALCDGNLDAFIYNSGHPIGAVSSAVATCGAIIAPVNDPAVDKLIAAYPYYSKAEIPAGIYPTVPNTVPTFAVYATVVSSTDVPDDAVYALTKAVFDNIERFRKAHVSFAKLEPKDMITKGITIPLHPGAARYYKEKGWIQ